jgi:hypothetical protein
MKTEALDHLYPSIAAETANEMVTDTRGMRVLDELSQPAIEVDPVLDRDVPSLSAFASLPREARRRLTELAGFYPQVERTGTVKPSKLKSRSERAFAASMLRFMDSRVRPGLDAKVNVEVFKLKNGAVVGGTVDIEESGSSAHGHFDYDGKPFYADDDLEWAG